MLRATVIEITRRRTSGRRLQPRETSFVVLEAELPRILANHPDIGPTKPGKSLTGYFAERRRKVDKVYAGEELGDVDKLGHGLNVPSSPSANLVNG